MRHSDPALTANVYTDPRLLDVHGALDALPNLPLDVGRDSAQEQARYVATGTYDQSAVALAVAQTGDKPRQAVCIGGQTTTAALEVAGRGSVAASGSVDKGKGVLTGGDREGRGMETKGIEPSTSWLQTRRSPN